MKPIFYETTQDAAEWRVWLPNPHGVIIGTGSSKTQALRDAIEHLTNTANMLRCELEALTQ